MLKKALILLKFIVIKLQHIEKKLFLLEKAVYIQGDLIIR